MKKSLNRITVLTIYYLKVVVRNKGRLVEIVAWPVLEILTFGFLSRFINQVSSDFTKAIIMILGALIFWHFFARIMNEIVMAFTDDIYSSNLSNLLITPLSTSELLSSLIISSLIKLSVNLLIILPLSWILYRLNLFSLGPIIAVYALILIIWGISLGIITCAGHLIFGRRAGALSWAIAGIIQPFSLVFYPRSILPPIAKELSYFIPASYIFEAFRLHAETRLTDTDVLSTASFSTLIYLAIAIIVFSFSFGYSRRSGIITKL